MSVLAETIGEDRSLGCVLAARAGRDPVLRAFLDMAAPDGYWLWDGQTPTTLWLSPAFRKLTGFPSPFVPDPASAGNRQVWPLPVHPEDDAELSQALNGVRADPSACLDIQVRYRRADGSWVKAACRGLSLPATDAAPALFIAAHRDAEILPAPVDNPVDRAVAANDPTAPSSDGTLQAVLDLAPIVAYRWIEHPDGRRGFSHVSGRLEELYGVSPIDLEQDYTILPLHPDDRERWDSSIRESIVSLSDWTFEGRLFLPDGSERWWLGKARPFRQTDGTVIFNGVIVDIHDRKLRELALAEAHHRLERQAGELATQAALREKAMAEAAVHRQTAEAANRAKSAFLATMSHELRTPLNAILGYSELMGMAPFGPLGDRRYTDYVGDIHTSGQALKALIEDLFDLAKIEAGHRNLDIDTCRLVDVIDKALRMVRPRCTEKNQLLHQQPVSAAITVRVDPNAVQQMLVNLLSNAVKFTPDGGSISVECRLEVTGGLTVAVIDSGPGIPADERQLIFQPFERGQRATSMAIEGTGLGLSIVQALMEMHGGTARVSQPTRGGARFDLIFPPGTILSAHGGD